MAARYWVGGTGTWDNSSTTHWAAASGGAGGASVPGASDTVTFDGSSGGGTVTPNYDISVVSITMGAFTGTLDFSANNNNVTLSSFNGSGSGTRTLNMGNGTWSITGNNTTVWTFNTITNLTFNSNSSTLQFTYPGSTGTRAIITGATTVYNNISVSAGSDIFSQTSGFIIKGNFSTLGFSGTYTRPGSNLDISGSFILGAGSTWASTGGLVSMKGSGSVDINTNGVAFNQAFTISGTGVFTLRNDLDMSGPSPYIFSVTQGTFSANNFNVTCATFNSSSSNTRAINMGNGTWTITGGSTTVWNLVTATNLTLNAGGSTLRFTYSGATGNRTIWHGVNTIVYNNVLISAGSDTIVQTGTLNTNGNFSTSGFTGTYNKTTNNLSIGGNFTLGPGSTWSSTGGTVTLTSTGSANINTNGVNFNQSLSVNGSGSFTLQNNLDCSGSNTATLAVTLGTFNANNFDIITAKFNSPASAPRTINMGSGTWSITGNNTTVWDTSSFFNLTLNVGASTVKFTYAGFTGTRTISTNASATTFNNFTISAGSDTFSQNVLLTINGNFSTSGFTGTYSKTTNDLAIGGDFILGTGSTWSSTGGTITLTSPGTANLNTNGVNLNQSLTINGAGSFILQNNLDCTGSNTPSFIVSQGTFNSNNLNINVAGNFTLTSGSVWTPSTGVITLSSSGSANVDTGGINLNQSISINGTGTFNLQSNIDCSGSVLSTFTITRGTFNAGSHNITAAIFNSSNTNTRTINMGSGTWTITGNNTSVWDISTTTGLTFNAGTSTLQFTYAGATGTRTINNGGLTYANFLITAGSDTISQPTALACTGSFSTVGFSGIYNKSNQALTVGGSFTLGTGSTWTTTGGTVTLNSSGSANINTNGVSFNQALTVNGTGSFTLQNNLDISGASVASFTVTNGTFNAGTYNITTGGDFTLGTAAWSSSGGNYTIGGNVVIGAGSTWSSTGGVVTLNSSGSVNINTNGINFNQSLTVNGTGTFTLQNNLDCSGSVVATLTVTQGTFNANNYNVTAAIFNSSNTNVRTITMGSGIWSITGNNATVWNLGTITNLTFNSNTSTLQFTYSGSLWTRTISTGASTIVYNNVAISAGSDIISQSGVFTINGNFSTAGFTGTYNKTTGSLTISGDFILGTGSTWSSTGGTITLTSSGSANINTNGVNCNQIITINGTGSFTLQGDLDNTGSVSTSLTITQGTFNANNFNVTINFFNSSNTNTRTINMGSGTWTVVGSNATVWTTGTTTNLTFNSGTSTLRFTYAGANGTRTISTGASIISYNNIIINAGTDTILQAGSFIINGDFSTAGFTGIYSKTTSSLTIGGSFILGSGSTWSSTSGTVTLTSSGSANINTNGVNVNQAITINGTGSFTLQNNLDCTGSNSNTLTVIQGTFNANNFNITVALFNSSNTNVRTINMGNGVWAITGGTGTVFTVNTTTNLTLNANGSAIKFTDTGSGSRSFATGSILTFNDIYITGGSGAFAIASMTCRNFITTGFTGPLNKTSATIKVSGDFILGAGSAWSSTSGTITLSTAGTSIFNTNGVNVNQAISIAATGTVTLMSDLDMTGSVNAVLTLTSGTFDANNFNITMFSFSGTGTNARTLTMGNGTWTITGNNITAWNISTITNLTFNSNGSTLQFTYAGSTGTRGFTTGATTIAYNHVLVTAGSDTFTLGGNLTVNGNFSTNGFTGTFLKTSTNLTIGGNFTLGSGSNWSSTSGAITLVSASSVNINTNGVNVNMVVNINGTGTFTLQNNLDTTGSIAASLTVTNGTFSANNYNVSSPLFNSSNSNARTINMGNGTWTITGNNAAVWTMTTITNLTFNAGGSTLQFTYPGSAGTRTITFNLSLSYNNISITAGSDIVSMGSSFTCSGNFSTAGFTGTFSKLVGNITAGGNFTLGTGSTWSSTGGTITLTSPGSANITTNGVNVNQSLNINGTGTFALQNNLDISGSVAATLTVTTGTFIANNFDVKAGFFASNNSNTRTVNMGTGTWTLTGSGGAAWNLTTITNLTLVIGASAIVFTNTDTGTVTMNTGGGTILYNAIWFNRGAGGSNVISGDLNCNSFTDTGTAAHTLTVNSGNTLTVNNSWNVTGAAGNLITLTSSAPATGVFNLVNTSGAPYVSDYLDIQHSIATPGNYWLAGMNSVNNQDAAALGAGWAFSSQPVIQAGFFLCM